MTSAINPNINENFPIAGVDNNTQGFRDNFSIIKNSLSAAYNEITDLQNKAVLKSNLSGSTLNNDMQGNSLINPNLVRSTLSVKRYTANALPTQIVEFGDYYHVFEISQNTNFVLSQFPVVNDQSPEERLSQIRIELNSAGGAGSGTVRVSISNFNPNDPNQKIYYRKSDIAENSEKDRWSGSRTVTIDNTNPKMLLDVWTPNGKTFYIQIVGSFQE